MKRRSTVVKLEESEDSANTSEESSRETSPSVDDICGLVLSNAFNISLSQVSHPEEAWESVRRCLNELSVITSLSHEHSPSPSEGHVRVANSFSRDADPEQTASENSLLPDDGHHGVNRDRKRRRSDASGGPSRRGGNSNNNDDEKNGKCSENGSKTRKKGKTNGRYTCPYRKRNPLRFNVRQHPSCATVAHDSISLVKRHIRLFHQRTTANSFVCRRCQETFPTSETLDNHIRVPSDQMCMIREQGIYNVIHHDPEDGITTEEGIKLADRKSRTQVLDWSTLWEVLFPEDGTVPSEEFEPVIELDEVKQAFADDSERCQNLGHDLSDKICRSSCFDISSKPGER
ncbi:hypothetical protein K456DRAFT_467012 [Colletotrichum gloeosporioides 23]|nr:hypothetical protein K456DRAFT_467012 [Colletotrichum gloeosporioides 23]